MDTMLRCLGFAVTLLAMTTSAAETVADVMTAAHNEVRRQHGVQPLRWAETLAEHAAEWAAHLAVKGCELEHARDTGEGENLFWASAVLWSDGRREIQAITPAQVVKDWASEQVDYDYASNRCGAGKMCGHYTQIIWKGTEQVGCAKHACADKSQIWVCRYLPPGNWMGERPY